MAALPAGRKEPGRDSPPDRAGSVGAECSPVGERWNGTEPARWRVGAVLSPAGRGAGRGGGAALGGELGVVEGGGRVLLKAMSFVFELI